MAIIPTSSDSSAELSGKIDSPAVSDGADAESVSGEEVEVEEDGDEEDPEEVLEEEDVSEDGDEGDPEEVLEEEEEEAKEDGVEDAPEEIEEEEEEEVEEDGEEEEEGEEDEEEPVEEEEMVEEEIEVVEEEEVGEVEREIAEEEDEVAEEDGEEPVEEDEEEDEVADEEDSAEEVEEEVEEDEGEEEIDAGDKEGVEEEVEEAEEVKGGEEDIREVLEEDNVEEENEINIGKKVDEDVVREEVTEGEVMEEEVTEGEVMEEEEEMKDMVGDGEEGGVVEEEVKQEDEAMKGGEEDVKVEDVGEKVEEEDFEEGRKEGTGSPIIDTRDISAKIESEGLGGPNIFSCTPERCDPSTTVVHVKDGNGGNRTASNPSDETGSGAQMEEDMPTESLKDVEQVHDSQIGLVLRDSLAGQYTRLDQENNISVEKKNEHGDVLELEAPHLHMKTDLQTREGLSLSSMLTPEKRPRSSSPDAVIKHANKRPAIICDFFARGWCIKGKSCSFLHQKEGVSNTSLQTKDIAGINRNGGSLHGTGLREDVERSNRSASQELLNFSNTESSSKSPLTAQKDLVRAYGDAYELPKLHYDYNMHGAHPQSRGASYAPINDFRQPFSREEYKRSFGPSPHFDAMDERRLAGDNLLSGRYPTSHFPSQDSRTSYSSTSSLRASTHGFTRMGAEHLDARMPSDFDRGNYGYRSASLSKNISSYCSTSEVPHTAHRDVPLAGKTAEVRDAWAPSIPFRSSFCRDPTNIPSYRSQYDPVLDSITPSNVAKSTFEAIQNVSNQHMNGGTTSSGIHTPGYGAQQSFFSQHHEAVLGKSKVDHGLNGSAATSATPEPSTVDGGSNFMSKKDEHWISGHAVGGANVNDAEAGFGGDLKNTEDKGRNNKDSRAMKFFHCALVDFVKELVKPSWREGNLSKDAHKMVVKKAVEKVLSAIQPHQVPGNAELVNQYLSSSRSKILKLVEGYVEKYSKSDAS